MRRASPQSKVATVVSIAVNMQRVHADISAWILCSFGPPSRTLVADHTEMGVMPVHDAVGVNCENGATADIKA